MAIKSNVNVEIDFDSNYNKYSPLSSDTTETQPQFNNPYQYLANKSVETETLELFLETPIIEQKSEEIAEDPANWPYNVPSNSFGNEVIMDTEELSSENISAIILMYQDNKQAISDEYNKIKKMYEDVRTGALSWYMKENFWGWLLSGLAGAPITIDEATTFLQLTSAEEFKEITGYELEAFLTAEQDMLLLEQAMQNIDNSIVSLKYLEISKEKDFQNFSSSEYYYYTIENKYHDYISQEVFSNLTETEKKMLKYLENQDISQAITYLNDMEDIWNQRTAQIRCQKRIEELKNGTIDANELDTLANMLNVTGDGLVDGINSFFEGLVNSVTADGKLSVDQYERMLYISYLQENTNYLDNIYTVSNATGNMLPVVTISIITQAICPAAAPYVATGAMGISTYGNTLDQTLYEGYSRDLAILYSLSIAGSEVLMERFMGGLEGIGKNISKNFLINLGKEGLEEALTTVLQEGILDSIILGKEINLDELTDRTLESFVTGIIVAGNLNAYTRGITKIIYNNVSYQFNQQDLQNMSILINGLGINAVDALKIQTKTYEDVGNLSEQTNLPPEAVQSIIDMSNQTEINEEIVQAVNDELIEQEEKIEETIQSEIETDKTNALTNLINVLKAINESKALTETQKKQKISELLYILEKVKEAKAQELGDAAYHVDSKLEYHIDYTQDAVGVIQILMDSVVNQTELTETQKQQFREMGLNPDNSPQELLAIIRETIPQQQLEEFAERMQVSPEFAQEKLNQMLARIISNSDFTYRTSVDTLLEILESGRIKNGHETGSSSLGTGEGYFDTREYVESLIFDVNNSQNAADKPVYGMVMPTLDTVKAARYYLDNVGSDIGVDITTDSYGCVCIFKKGDIIDSTTITSGDSINYIGSSIASPASDPQLTGTFPGMLDQIETYEQIATTELTDLYNIDVNDQSDAYLEIQLHGEKAHQTSNLDKVVFIRKAPSIETIQALKEQNIGCEVLFEKKPNDVTEEFLREQGISYSYIQTQPVYGPDGKPIVEGYRIKTEEVLVKVNN